MGSLVPSTTWDAGPADGAHDELVALDDLDRAGVGAEQRRRLLCDLLEDRAGSSSVARRLPMRASCWESARDVRSLS